MEKTIEKVLIAGAWVEIIFTVVIPTNPLIPERIEMAWTTTIDGQTYGMIYPIEKVTRQNRDYLFAQARYHIDRIKSGLSFSL